MKYVLSFFVIFLVSFSVFWTSYSASNSIFNNTTTEVPYCNKWECWIVEWIEAVKGIDSIETKRSASEYIQAVVKYLLSFLALIATILIIYSGFNLLTWVGDEEKAKKTKQIIIFSIVWLVIIFLAWPIMDFVINVLNA